MERTTLAVRTLNKPKMVQKYHFAILLHTIQHTESKYHPATSSYWKSIELPGKWLLCPQWHSEIYFKTCCSDKQQLEKWEFPRVWKVLTGYTIHSNIYLQTYNTVQQSAVAGKVGFFPSPGNCSRYLQGCSNIYLLLDFFTKQFTFNILEDWDLSLWHTKSHTMYPCVTAVIFLNNGF